MPYKRFVVISSMLTTILVGLSAPGPIAQSSGPFTGHWVSRTDNGDGTFREVVIILSQTGSSLTGRVVNPTSELPIRDPQVTDNTVVFSTVAPGSNATPTTYRGMLAGSTLTVTIERPGRPSQQLTATRGSNEAGNTPARIEPPAVRTLADNGLARTPPMGWNSWNFFKGKIDDQTVRQIADAIVRTGMRDAGYIYVNIDDTWERGRDPSGRILTNRKFPDMKALADYVHAKGLKLGIYSSPGPTTCAGYEGSYGHESDDARTYAEWGIDYLKYDWCGAARIYTDAEMRPVYQKMADALRATARPIVFSLCQYGRQDVWTWGALAGGNLWRTTGDISDRWESMSRIGFDQGRLASFARPGHWNDPDMLEVGNGGMSPDEYRTHFSLWALLAAPLLAGNDIRIADPETLGILTNRDAIAIDQDPLGRQGSRIRQDGPIEVWKKPLIDGGVAVGLFNRGDEPTRVDVTWSESGLTGRRRIRDVWAAADRGESDKGYSAIVPRRGVVLIRLSAEPSPH
jgi:alpha-galactosidase